MKKETNGGKITNICVVQRQIITSMNNNYMDKEFFSKKYDKVIYQLFTAVS